ncbi:MULTISPECIES: ABC transporter permease [unclassified Blastococcus]
MTAVESRPVGGHVSPAPVRDRGRRGWTLVPRVAWSVLRHLWLGVLLVLLWEWAATEAASPFFPPPSAIVERLGEVWFGGPASRLFFSEAGWADFSASVQRLAIGWALAVVLGIGFGLLIGLSTTLQELTSPLITFALSVPATTLVPLAVVAFGITSAMNTALIVFGCVWGILVNTIDGVRHIDPTAMLSARSLRLPWRRRLTRIVLPAASPQIAAGIRVSLGIALVLMVVSELYAARSGIGYALSFSQRTFRFLDMWAAIVVIALLGLVVNGLFALVERRWLRWHTESRRVGEAA